VASSRRVPIRASGRTSPLRSPTVGRSATWPASSAATRRRRRSSSGGWPPIRRGYAALKTIAAYGGGLADLPPFGTGALEENEAGGEPLPVHAGFGDSDVLLPRADPGFLKPVFVFLDLSLTIPHVSRPVEALREALELAPVSKLMYALDAVAPELSFLAARWRREALAEVLAEALPANEAESAGLAILRKNALGLYRLTTLQPGDASA
jgi:hypothetical protein